MMTKDQGEKIVKPVLQAGFAKSGNMLLHVIIRAVLDVVGISYKSVICRDKEWNRIKGNFIFNSDLQPGIDVLHIPEGEIGRYTVSSLYEKPIYDLKKYVEGCSVVWTHSAFVPGVFDELLEWSAPIYIYRDGRAVLNSLVHYLDTEYAKASLGASKAAQEYIEDEAYCRGIFRAWKRNINSFMENRSKKVLFIKYESLISDKRNWIKKIARHMGLGQVLDEKSIDFIERQSSPETMKPRMPEHVRTCSNTEWRSLFPDRLIRISENEIGDTLLKLEYEVKNGNVAREYKKNRDSVTLSTQNPIASNCLEKLFQQGRNLIKEEKWNDALKIFSRLEDTEFDRFRCFVNQSIALENLADLQGALEKIKAAVRIRSYDLNAAIREAFLYSRLGKHKIALNKLRRLEKACPGDIRLRRTLGGLLVACRRYEGALSVFQRLIDRYPANYPLYLNLSDVLRLMNRFEEAFETVKKLEELNSQAQGIWLTRGKIHQAQGRYDTAKSCFLKEHKRTGNRVALALANKMANQHMH